VPRGLRNWLRSPSKSIEWLRDSISFWRGDTKNLELLPGWTLVCHPRVYKLFLESQLTDPEQSAEFLNFVKYCDPSMTLFDIGASYGVFSLAAAHFGGTAIAVDASPIAARLLRLQTNLNGYARNIRIVEACVTDTTGNIDMLSSGVFSHGYFRVSPGRPKSELTKISAVTIDELARQFGPPTHIKIDVEGHEAATLRGGKEVFASRAPLLFLELHNDIIRADGGDPGCIVDDLHEMKYEMYSTDGAKLDRSAILQTPICRLVARPLALSANG